MQGSVETRMNKEGFIMKEMSRRDLFKIGGVAAAGAMGASMSRAARLLARRNRKAETPPPTTRRSTISQAIIALARRRSFLRLTPLPISKKQRNTMS